MTTTAPPPVDSRTSVVAFAVVLAALLAVLAVTDPGGAGFHFPPCPIKAMTGFDCPGCGGLRATHALLHGDVAHAFALNPLYVASLPFALAWLAWRALAAFGAVRAAPVLTPRTTWTLVAIAIAYGVLRNLV